MASKFNVSIAVIAAVLIIIIARLWSKWLDTKMTNISDNTLLVICLVSTVLLFSLAYRYNVKNMV